MIPNQMPRSSRPKGAPAAPEPARSSGALGDAGASNVRAVTRALAVLSSFSGRRLQSLAEVTDATGLDKGTTRRLLLTLMGSGFVAQDPVSGRYRLGRALRDLAASVGEAGDLRAAALPLATEIATELRMTAFISVYDRGDVVCLERIHDMKGIEVHWWAVGGTLPSNCGAAPKLLLAYQNPDEIGRVLARPMAALTPRSITDPAALRRRLDLIRRRGWECAVDDVTLGLTALAVPIRDADGDVAGALSVAGLTPAMVERGRPLRLNRLKAAAATIEDILRADASR